MCGERSHQINMKQVSVNNKGLTLKNGEYNINCSSSSLNVVNIKTEVNSNCYILFEDLSNIKELNITVLEGSFLKLAMILDQELNNIKINIDVLRQSSLEGYVADFAKNELNFDCVINLKEEGANCFFKLASLSAEKDNKNINVSVNHLVAKTYGKVDNYGVCKDLGRLLFAGTSYILNGAIKSKTEQNAKIMVFDEASNAIAKPILKIDENDIEASHAAVVGKINDEHLFYLTSRGISETEAKELITFGYLKPILKGFNDEKNKEYISSLIERRM